jgi:hypothetical protein
MGSQGGSQRVQLARAMRRRRANIAAGQPPTWRQQAASRDPVSVYGMQEVRGSPRSSTSQVRAINSNGRREAAFWFRSYVQSYVDWVEVQMSRSQAVRSLPWIGHVTSCIAGKRPSGGLSTRAAQTRLSKSQYWRGAAPGANRRSRRRAGLDAGLSAGFTCGEPD